MDNDITTIASHCPTCGMEYRADFDTCADDGTALVAGPAPVPGEAVSGDAWAEANERFQDGWTTPGQRDTEEADADDHPEPAVLCRLPSEEAVLLAGALRAAGIESMAAGQGYVPLQPYLTRAPDLSGFEDVLVPADRLEEARQIARELLEDSEG